MKSRHILIVESQRENLPLIAEFVEEHLLKLGVSDKEIFEVGLAVDEACSNIILHGCGDGDGTIEIELAVSQDRIAVTLTDNCRPFNPLTVEPPDLCDDIERRKVGGLGVFLIKKTMDEVGYEYRDGKNILFIAKDRSGLPG